MRIGIIGAGSMGRILARHVVKLGHRVAIANSNGPESLTAFAAEIGAIPVSVADDLGFDPVDGGDLDNSWRQQTGTPAYCRDLEAAALRRALAEADRSRIAE